MMVFAFICICVRALGGRDDWLSFVASVPAAWTVYGLWITYYERIAGGGHPTMFMLMLLCGMGRI